MTWAGFIDEAQQPLWAIAMEIRIKTQLTKQGAQLMGLKDDLDAVLAQNAAAKTQLEKARAEIVAKIADLEEKLAAGQDVAQEVADLKAMAQGFTVEAQSLDDVVPDEPPA